jgi:hypothetical protein
VIVLSPWSGLIADKESPAMLWRFVKTATAAEATSRGIGSAKPKNA